MSQAALIGGLLLPWIAGYLWLAAVQRYVGAAGSPGQGFRLAGYGFFLGYALLYGLTLAVEGLSGTVSFGPVMGLLALTAALGAGACYGLRSRVTPPPDGKAVRSDPAQRILTWLLLAWMGLHLLFALIDVLAIPVFPWDAWLVWIYRAKAWFYSGGLAEMVSASDWIRAAGPTPYTVDAIGYPGFVSVIAYWAALSLGAWSETLVNLPGWLCGLAIGLALYGQGRGQGLSVLAAVALTYLLFSTPLFGAHLALGGYADIWMAGFAGLGLVALLAGLAGRDRRQLILGLLMVGFSLCVKNEGLVWLVLALAMLVLVTVRARNLWIGAGLVAALAVLAALSGITYLDLPGLGRLGVTDGQVYLPLLGAYPLQTHAVWREYLVNFFTLGSWHLLWALVLGGLLLACRRPHERRQRAVLAFLALFIASQAFIFGFTEQGEWASRFTAINRLPLQLLPALLFAVALAFGGGGAGQTAAGARRWWIAPASAAVLVVIGAVMVLSAGSATGPSAALDYAAGDLRFMAGAGSERDGAMVVEQYQQGVALVSSGPVTIRAEDFPVLRLNGDFAVPEDPALAPAFFWRRAGQPAQVSRLGLADGAGIYDLDQAGDWAGQVTEVGLLFRETAGPPPRLGGLSLQGRGLANQWQLTRRGWLAFEPWSQRSVNFIWGGAERQALPLPVLLLAWAVLALLLMRLPALRVPWPATTSAALMLLAAWMVLDLRWTANGAWQAAQSWGQGLRLSDSQRLNQAADAKVYAFIERFREKFPAEAPRRILIVGDINEFEAYLQRAKYHLLPDSAMVSKQLNERFDPAKLDYVLFIDDFAARRATWAETWQRLPISEAWRERLELADSGELVVLFSVQSD
jgi:hypothetical protein